MLVQLIGIQPLHFTSSNGDVINGTNLYVAYNDENVQGLKADRFFAKDGITLPKDTKINDKIEITFNCKGKIEGVFKIN